MSLAKESVQALARLALARLTAEDYEGASRALSWLSFIARDEADEPLDEWEKDEMPLLEAWVWFTALKASVDRKTPMALGTIVERCRKALRKVHGE